MFFCSGFVLFSITSNVCVAYATTFPTVFTQCHTIFFILPIRCVSTLNFVFFSSHVGLLFLAFSIVVLCVTIILQVVIFCVTIILQVVILCVTIILQVFILLCYHLPLCCRPLRDKQTSLCCHPPYSVVSPSSVLSTLVGITILLL